MTITYIIVTILIAAGSWIGSDFNTKSQLSRLPPKYQYITQIQTTENRNSQITSQESTQITIVTPMTNFNVNYNGKTNISVTKSSRTNKSVKSNK